jgi:cell division protein FtsL
MSTRASNVTTDRRAHITVARRKKRNLIVRKGGRRIAPMTIICVIAVLAIVFGVLLEQVVLAQSAFKLARVRERLVAAENRHHELLLEAAKLESSDRIEAYAKSVLGMVPAVSSDQRYIVADIHRGRGIARIADRYGSRSAGFAAGSAVGPESGP